MDQINWGVLGTAGIAEKLTINGMKQAPNCRLYAIAGRNPEKTSRFQKEFGFVRAYSSYEELLDDENVQAVYIPLPNNLHKEWVMKAAGKGKHILCEKPLSGNEKDTSEMIGACKKNGCVLMEGFAYLHSPFVKEIKEVIDSGGIGTLRAIDSSFLSPTHPLTNIRMRLENLGGSIYDLGCYNTSLALTLLGKAPRSVDAIGRLTDEGIDQYATIQMDFGDGVLGFSNSGMVLQPGQRKARFTIYGSNGIIDAPDYMFNATGELTFSVLTNGDSRTQRVFVPDNYMLEIEQLGHCILSGQEPLVTHDLTLNNARLVDKALKSIGYGTI